MRRGEVWWADLGAYRPREQTGRRPVIIWQGDALEPRIRARTQMELAELELATDEALGRIEPKEPV